MKNKQFIFKIISLILILSILFIFTACDKSNENTGLENGFEIGAGCASPPNLCAYKSDKVIFDIDDVTFDFYYGVSYINNYYKGCMLLDVQSFPVFDVLFQDENGKEYIVKHVEENFVSEKYRVEKIFDENYNVTEIIFNHSETLTVPKEVFIYNKGYFYFQVRGDNMSKSGTKNQTITGACIYYKVEGEQVILSSKKFK